MQRAGADKHRDFLAAVENVSRAAKIDIRRDNARRLIAHSRVHRAMFAWRDRNRVHFLHVVWNDNAGDSAFGFRDANGTIDQMPDRRRARSHVHVFVRDIFEQTDKIDFLLIIAADRGPSLLPDNRNNRGVIHFRVVESVEQMNCAGPGGGETNSHFASELRMRARHERGHLLVPNLHIVDRIARTIDGANDAVDAVPRITVNAPDTPLRDSLDQEIARRFGHTNRIIRLVFLEREMPLRDKISAPSRRSLSRLRGCPPVLVSRAESDSVVTNSLIAAGFASLCRHGEIQKTPDRFLDVVKQATA